MACWPALTVYAVPQVLAATLPIGALSNQIGTVIKLVRVLMLGPVVLAMSLLTSRLREETDEPAPHVTAGERPKRGGVALHQLVPWFIVGFLLVACARNLGLIPAPALAPITRLANGLTTVSMAALGLGVDVRGGRQGRPQGHQRGHPVPPRARSRQLRPHPPRRDRVSLPTGRHPR